ncbi:hypothetical protein [Leptospira kanakyensis]|uniref:hypothetical protein n=1 Tax=Leptospira kanakyensis TaxID=2484968 RepID=UPI00223D15FF|nr:hypothetical protein [Leptospira kanakyensis]MCW7468844.1 hypothetical protein [Leptospira kanakyensis]MCW7479831.1 hypothetical protein [Leptospira kanakyensis]
MKQKIYKLTIILVSFLIIIYTSLFIYAVGSAYYIREKTSVINELKISKSTLSDKSLEPIYIFKCESNSVTLPLEVCENFKQKYPKLCSESYFSFVLDQYDFCDSIDYKGKVQFGNVSCPEHLYDLFHKNYDNTFFLPFDELIQDTSNILFLESFFAFHKDYSIDLLRLENGQLEVISKTNISIVTKTGSLLHLELPSEVNKSLESILQYSKFIGCDVVKNYAN